MRLALLIPLLAVGLVSFIYVRSEQGSGGTLLYQQSAPGALTAAEVARAVRVAPDPATNRPGVAARCVALGTGELRNPWRCTITYRAGKWLRYDVTLSASGSYFGDHQLVHDQGRTYPSPGDISGCCVQIP